MPIKNFDAQLVNFAGEFVFDAKRDFTGRVVLDEKGQPTPEPAFLRGQISNAVGAKYQGDEALPFDEQLKRGELARKIAKGGNIELTEEEIVQIKTLVAKGASIVVIQQFSEALKAEVPN